MMVVECKTRHFFMIFAGSLLNTICSTYRVTFVCKAFEGAIVKLQDKILAFTEMSYCTHWSYLCGTTLLFVN